MYDDIVMTNGKIINIKADMLIPDNATNGDVIKALFPDAGQPHFYGVKNGCFDADWWNAPYKAGKRGGK
jgi:hypothetical protein